MADGKMVTEDSPGSPFLAGSAATPQEPKKRIGNPFRSGENVGEDALRDGLILVLFAWAFLFFLTWSLRHHNN